MTKEELRRLFDISVSEMDDGLAKVIMSKKSYKDKIYKKIDEVHPRIHKSRNIMRCLCGKYELIPVTKISGNWDRMPCGKSKFTWLPNSEIKILLTSK